MSNTLSLIVRFDSRSNISFHSPEFELCVFELFYAPGTCGGIKIVRPSLPQNAAETFFRFIVRIEAEENSVEKIVPLFLETSGQLLKLSEKNGVFRRLLRRQPREDQEGGGGRGVREDKSSRSGRTRTPPRAIPDHSLTDCGRRVFSNALVRR